MWFAAFFAAMTAFWAYVTFRGARWKANEEGPSVWDYAFFGVMMTGMCGIATAIALIAWWP